MATNFPTSLDNFTNPVSGNTLDSPSHSGQHSDINDAVEAIETKLGIGASPAGSAVAGQVLTISTAGTSAWTTPTTPGLVQVVPTSVAVGSGSGSVDANGAVTFSGASSVSLNNAFTSTYENYLIIVNYTNATSAVLNMRLRASGTDESTANAYGSHGYYGVSNSNTVNGEGVNAAQWATGYATNTIETSEATIWVYSPQISTKRTMFKAWSSYYDNTNFANNQYAGGHKQIASYDGFTLFQSAGGTITGTIRVYGYKN